MFAQSNPRRSLLSVTPLEDRLAPAGTQSADPYQPPPPPQPGPAVGIGPQQQPSQTTPSSNNQM